MKSTIIQNETLKHEASFVLSLPPSVNESYADILGKDGKRHRVATAILKNFKKHSECVLQHNNIPHPAWKLAKQIGYEATFYMPTHGSDCSNRIKALEDSLAETLGFNDNRIMDLHCKKDVDGKNPRVEARLYVIK